ncbi:hypothetical protein NLX86_18640 [Streptomyces sp. A3M-1-3]|uniref:hypothetical protein n=1 Tax=Streptomyces sp. A3M-1-3 TaxID=2962044 RepID=UPI0020B662C0|nr:hypothetical protein [Streptomyces sp. A3M-1-3]MCP3820035.1 hypothetical protein [Streptomyces sp. A3M-1-3]
MRVFMGATGVLLMGVGAALLAGGGQLADVAVWLAGAVVLHDGVIAPLVLAAGLLLAGVPARGAVRAALVVAGCLTVVALPVLLRPGAPTNPSALPLDYVQNWLLVLGAVAVVTAALPLARRLRSRPRRQK